MRTWAKSSPTTPSSSTSFRAPMVNSSTWCRTSPVPAPYNPSMKWWLISVLPSSTRPPHCSSRCPPWSPRAPCTSLHHPWVHYQHALPPPTLVSATTSVLEAATGAEAVAGVATKGLRPPKAAAPPSTTLGPGGPVQPLVLAQLLALRAWPRRPSTP